MSFLLITYGQISPIIPHPGFKIIISQENQFPLSPDSELVIHHSPAHLLRLSLNDSSCPHSVRILFVPQFVTIFILSLITLNYHLNTPIEYHFSTLITFPSLFNTFFLLHNPILYSLSCLFSITHALSYKFKLFVLFFFYFFLSHI